MKVYALFIMAILITWAVASSKSEVDSELILLLRLIMTDPEYLSLNAHEQYKVLSALYAIIVGNQK